MLRASLALTLTLTLASTALAQEPTADQLIEHGVALREDGRDAEALAIFQRANETSPSGQAMAQIALAEHALGQLVEAETHLTQALADGSDRFVRRNREALEGALEEIRSQLTDLTLTGGVDGAEVLLDGTSRGTMPLAAPLRVQAGTTHLEVHASGYLAFSREVIVNAGTPITMDVALEHEPVAPPPPPEPEPVRAPDPLPAPAASTWMLPTGIALAAAGVVGIGVASGLMAWREDNAVARLSCVDTDPACRARYGTAVDAETAGIATYVVSGLLVAGGAVLLTMELLGTSQTPRSGTEIACAPGLLSLSCAGRF